MWGYLGLSLVADATPGTGLVTLRDMAILGDIGKTPRQWTLIPTGFHSSKEGHLASLGKGKRGKDTLEPVAFHPPL